MLRHVRGSSVGGRRLLMLRSRMTTTTTKTCNVAAGATAATILLPRYPHQVHTSPLALSFHTSTPVSLAVRRRRYRQRGGGASAAAAPPTTRTAGASDDKDDFDDERPVVTSSSDFVTDPAVFVPHARALLAKLYHALVPLQAANSDGVFELKLGTGLLDETSELDGDYLLLDVGPILGMYVVQMDPDECIVALSTPLSGQATYGLILDHDNDDDDDTESQQWCSTLDGHALEGMFVRDFIRQCHGVPQL